MTPYEVSVAKCLRGYHNARFGGLDLPNLLFRYFSLMPRSLASQVPVELLALKGFKQEANLACYEETLRMTFLVQVGWGLETSLMMYRNFRLMHPTDPRGTPDMYRLLDREGLRQVLGHTWGNLIADCIGRPHSQPIFYRLLLGELGAPVEPAFMYLNTTHALSAHLLSAMDEAKTKPQWDTERILERLRDPTLLALPTVAAEDYKQLTGCDLPTTLDIGPHLHDYHQLAESARTLWETDRPED